MFYNFQSTFRFPCCLQGVFSELVYSLSLAAVHQAVCAPERLSSLDTTDLLDQLASCDLSRSPCSCER